jgi:hypothetical protein
VLGPRRGYDARPDIIVPRPARRGIFEHNARVELRALGALRMPIVKTQQKPFSLHFSPFPTIFPMVVERDSLDESRVGPFSWFSRAL